MAPLTTLRRRLRDRKAARDRQIRRWRRTGTGAKSVRGHVRAIRYLRRLITRAQTVSGISDELVEFVADFEGFYATPYNDPAGFATVGYGHLLGYRPVAASDHRARWVEGQAVAGRVTEAEARTLLAESLREKYEPPVLALFERGGPFYGKFEQTFYDGLVSAVYNLGPGAVTPGTTGFETIGRAIASGDRRAVADSLLLYDRAGGQQLPGLTRRRKAERRLILTGNYSTRFPYWPKPS